MSRLFSFLFVLSCSCSFCFAELLSIPVEDFESGKVPRRGGEGIQPESKTELVGKPVHGGKKAARLHYVFRRDVKPRQYVELTVPKKLHGGVKQVSVWIFGDGLKQMLKLRVLDGSGEVFQFRYGYIDWKGWKKVTFDLSKNLEGTWSGNSDRKLDPPLRSISFLVDSPVRPCTSDLYFDDVSILAEGNPFDFLHVEVKGQELANAFYACQPEFTIAVSNGLEVPQNELSMSLQVLDLQGRSVMEQERVVDVPARGEVSLPLSFQLADFGLYHLVVKAAGREKRVALSYLPEAAAKVADVKSPFGVSMHFGHGSRGPLENNFKLASDMGIRWLRDDASWGSVEREKGVYKVPAKFDHFLRTSRSEWGCEPLIILDYSNGLYCENRAVANDAERQAFANWAEYMARTYKDSVTYWEVWNEANISGFWKPKPNPKDYALLLKATYAAVKRGNPDAQVVAMVTAGISTQFIEDVLKEGTVGFFDAISVHPYRYPAAPEAGKLTMLGHLRKLVALLKKYGVEDTPVYNSEVGWPNQEDPRGLPEETSANYLSRMYVQLHEIPTIKSTFWYDFQDDGTDRKYNENNFGLLHNDFTPKAPAVAYRMTSYALQGKTFVKRLKTEDGIYAYLFANDRESTLALWSAKGENSLVTSWKTAKVTAISALGPIRTLPVRDGVLPVALNDTPIFLTAPGKVQLAAAPLSVPDKLWLSPRQEITIPFELQNPWRRSCIGAICATAPEGWEVEVPEKFFLGSRRSLDGELRVKAPKNAESAKLLLVCKTDKGQFLGQLLVPITVVPTLTCKVELAAVGESLGWKLKGETALAEPVEITAVTMSPGTAVEGQVVWEPNTDKKKTTAGGILLSHCFKLSGMFRPEELSILPRKLTFELGLANGEKMTVERQVNLWNIPRISKTADWAGIFGVPVSDFDGPGKEKWSGEKDLSASVKLGQDEGGLLLRIAVEDDVHCQKELDFDSWRGDGIQVSLITDPFGKSERSEFGLALSQGKPCLYRWAPKRAEGKTKDVQLEVKRQGTQTVYEARILWTALASRPQPGEFLGFSLLVNDNDGKGREGWMSLFDAIGWRKEAEKHGLLQF